MKRGVWTHDRQLALLVAYRDHRPYGVGHGEKTKKWELVIADVNKKDQKLTPLRKQAVIDKLHDLISQYKPMFTELEPNKASGSNRFASDIEREAYATWQAVSYTIAIYSLFIN
jgi:hypothetical protein